jgi:alanyl-tRNA synthetase
VTQKGSLVAPDRLRFDISHPKALATEEMAAVEAEVNRQIGLKKDVVTRLMEPDAAVEAGAMALFGEKYGDEVRVVSMGESGGGSAAGDAEGEAAYSTELCGGTHVRNTGDIEIFKLLSESAVAAGVRRIEALTGDGARAHSAGAEQSLTDTTALLQVEPRQVPRRVGAMMAERRELERVLVDSRRQLAAGSGGGGEKADNKSRAVTGDEAETVSTDTDDILGQTAALLKVQPAQVPERVEALLAECRKLEGDIDKVRDKIASGGGGAAEIKDVGGISYQPRLLDAMPAKELKSLADELKKQMGSGVIALVSVNDGKASVVVGVTDDLTERTSAVDLVRIGSVAVGGKGGGGRPDMAQAGGPDGAKGQAALDAIEAAIAELG